MSKYPHGGDTPYIWGFHEYNDYAYQLYAIFGPVTKSPYMVSTDKDDIIDRCAGMNRQFTEQKKRDSLPQSKSDVVVEVVNSIRDLSYAKETIVDRDATIRRLEGELRNTKLFYDFSKAESDDLRVKLKNATEALHVLRREYPSEIKYLQEHSRHLEEQLSNMEASRDLMRMSGDHYLNQWCDVKNTIKTMEHDHAEEVKELWGKVKHFRAAKDQSVLMNRNLRANYGALLAFIHSKGLEFTWDNYRELSDNPKSVGPDEIANFLSTYGVGPFGWYAEHICARFKGHVISAESPKS